jgi:hypothetical protein
MSEHGPNRKWRFLRRGLAVLLAVMATAASAVWARSPADHAWVQTRAAMTGANATAVAVPTAGHVLGGFTSQGWPVVLEISGNGKRIALVATGLDMGCTSGSGGPLEDGWQQLPIRAKGKVHAAITLPPFAGATVSITGGSRSFSGRFNRARSAFSGQWRLHLDFKYSNGQTDHCDSGRVTFTATL